MEVKFRVPSKPEQPENNSCTINLTVSRIINDDLNPFQLEKADDEIKLKFFNGNFQFFNIYFKLFVSKY